MNAISRMAGLSVFVAAMVCGDTRMATATDSGTSTKPERNRAGWQDELKGRDVKNVLNAVVEAPPDKGGRKSRQAMCRLRVNNQTPWTVQIGIEERYGGTVAPWGDALGAYQGGSVRAFAVAEFEDGSTQSWGPTTIRCFGTHTWTLEP